MEEWRYNAEMRWVTPACPVVCLLRFKRSESLGGTDAAGSPARLPAKLNATNGEGEAQRARLTHRRVILRWGCAENPGCPGCLLEIQIFSAPIILALGWGLR